MNTDATVGKIKKYLKKKSYDNHQLVSGKETLVAASERNKRCSLYVTCVFNSAAGVNFKSSYIRLFCIQAEIAKTKCLKMCVSLYIRGLEMKGVSVVTAGIRCRSFNGFSETTFRTYR